MKLNRCQATACNKFRKVVYENFPFDQVKRCNRVLEFQDCCAQSKGYEINWFGCIDILIFFQLLQKSPNSALNCTLNNEIHKKMSFNIKKQQLVFYF